MNDMPICMNMMIQCEYEMWNVDMYMNMNKWMMYNDECVWI